eukprot:scaffold5360_cov118-Isochrysis_galbana.AAC.3
MFRHVGHWYIEAGRWVDAVAGRRAPARPRPKAKAKAREQRPRARALFLSSSNPHGPRIIPHPPLLMYTICWSSIFSQHFSPQKAASNAHLSTA